MKNYINTAACKLLTLSILIVLGSVSQVQSLLLKSEIDENREHQNVTVYFTEGRINGDYIKILFGDSSSDGKEIKHDGKCREISQGKLTQTIKEIIFSNYMPLKNVRTIKFNFQNISNKKHFDLLDIFMIHINNMASGIIDRPTTRLTWIDVDYFYWDDQRNPLRWNSGRSGWSEGSEELKKGFEKSIEKLNEIQTKIQKSREEHRAAITESQRQFTIDENLITTSTH